MSYGKQCGKVNPTCSRETGGKEVEIVGKDNPLNTVYLLIVQMPSFVSYMGVIISGFLPVKK